MIVLMLGTLLLSLTGLPGCTPEDEPLAAYADVPAGISKLIIEDNTYTPKVTWLGGYATVLGVSRGPAAVLDTSMVWMVVQRGNVLRYPVKFGELPSGATDLTTMFGGTRLSALREDENYTYWVMKEDAWAAVSQMPTAKGKTLVADSLATSLVRVSNDSLFVNANSLVIASKPSDVYINMVNFKAFGRLAELFVTTTDTSNRLAIRWVIRQDGVTDSSVSAIGIVRGQTYDVNTVVWEMISAVKITPDSTAYWVHNVIPQPMLAGAKFANTMTFTEYPVTGLERGYTYMLWIANKDWDREGRTRATPFYAYATFDIR
jgi:hypothetical protein